MPVLAKEIPLMREQLPVLFDRLHAMLSPWLAQFGVNIALDLTSLREQLVAYLQTNWGAASARSGPRSRSAAASRSR